MQPLINPNAASPADGVGDALTAHQSADAAVTARIRALEVVEAERRAWEARRLELLAELADTVISGDPDDAAWQRTLLGRSLQTEVGMVLQLGERQTERLIDAARLLHSHYPVLAAAVTEGTVPAPIAQLAVEIGETLPNTSEVEDSLRRAGYEEAVLGYAKVEAATPFRKSAERLVAQFSKDFLEERHALAKTRRHVRVVHGVDGMAGLYAELSAEHAMAIADRLRKMRKDTVRVENAARAEQAAQAAQAKQAADAAQVGAQAVQATQTGEGASAADAADVAEAESGAVPVEIPVRSVGEIEADIFTSLLLEGVLPLEPVTGRGIRGIIQVVIPASDVGLAPNTPVCTDTGTPLLMFPSEIVGYGAIDPHTARELAATTATWSATQLDAEGGVQGTMSYPPTAADKRFVQIRDIHCRAPGCRVPAHRCEIDHSIPWSQGGPTCRTNLGHLCKRHHDMKHHSGWKLSHEHGGLFRWESPSGLERVEPAPSKVRFKPVKDPLAKLRPPGTPGTPGSGAGLRPSAAPGSGAGLRPPDTPGSGAGLRPSATPGQGTRPSGQAFTGSGAKTEHPF